MRKKRGDDDVVQGDGDGRVTPEDVQQVEFRLSFRGYNERDVDAFLDRITADLSSYLDELGGLRGGTPATAFAPGDVTEAQGQAGQIISRAREQAAAIVREAEQQAAAIRAGAAVSATGGDTRAAVAPFLNTEREFLQRLGTLVQTHAEEIKQMVLTLRSREGAPGDATTAASRASAPPPPPVAPDQSVGGASTAEIRERLGRPESPPPAPERRVTIDTATEPAYSSEGAPAGDPRERSLRELFWGED
jgi:DivIVA domain-containing protein